MRDWDSEETRRADLAKSVTKLQMFIYGLVFGFGISLTLMFFFG